jgi:hypothetical protein
VRDGGCRVRGPGSAGRVGTGARWLRRAAKVGRERNGDLTDRGERRATSSRGKVGARRGCAEGAETPIENVHSESGESERVGEARKQRSACSPRKLNLSSSRVLSRSCFVKDCSSSPLPYTLYSTTALPSPLTPVLPLQVLLPQVLLLYFLLPALSID